MKLSIDGISEGQVIPERFAFGVPDPQTHVRLGENVSPGIRWHDAPDGTRTLVLICVDDTVPTRPDDVNQEGRTVPASLPRGLFYHWVMVDLFPGSGGFAEGTCGRGVIAGGKAAPPGPAGARQGRNDYSNWFAGDPEMRGAYLGYDGPCPPWNDEIPHRYHFILYATDLERCPVNGAFTAQEVVAALSGHVLAEARVTGLYSLNPAAVPGG